MRAVVICWLQNSINQTLIYQITQLLYDDSSVYLLFTSWIWEHAHWLEFRINIRKATHNIHTDRKNATNFLYLVLHLARKVTFYLQLFNSLLVSVLRTSINVLSKSKARNYVTWISNLTKLFLSVKSLQIIFILILKLQASLISAVSISTIFNLTQFIIPSYFPPHLALLSNLVLRSFHFPRFIMCPTLTV